MLVIRVRECSTRHHVLREVLGYQASTEMKLLTEAAHTHTLNTLTETVKQSEMAGWFKSPPWLSGMVGTRLALKRKISDPLSSLPPEHVFRLSVNHNCSSDSS